MTQSVLYLITAEVQSLLSY